MFAWIGVLRVLNRHVERVFEPSQRIIIGESGSSKETASRPLHLTAKGRLLAPGSLTWQTSHSFVRPTRVFRAS